MVELAWKQVPIKELKAMYRRRHVSVVTRDLGYGNTIVEKFLAGNKKIIENEFVIDCLRSYLHRRWKLLFEHLGMDKLPSGIEDKHSVRRDLKLWQEDVNLAMLRSKAGRVRDDNYHTKYGEAPAEERLWLLKTAQNEWRPYYEHSQ